MLQKLKVILRNMGLLRTTGAQGGCSLMWEFQVLRAEKEWAGGSTVSV